MRAAVLGRRAAKAGRAAGALALQRLQRADGGGVLYNSFNGQFSDSPRAIYEELRRRAEPGPHVWVAGEPSHDFRPATETVAPDSWGYLREVGRTKYLVSNVQMPTDFRKRTATRYLQTWHGTPLKRIGLDNDRWRSNPAGLRRFLRDTARWDYLVSPNGYSSEIFSRAFRFDGEIVETGYPRNDILSSPSAGEVRDRVRRELGIEEGVTAVLYAPTWRDNLVDERGRLGFSLALDMERMAARLSEGHVVLLRLHHLLAPALGDAPGTFVRNVSKRPDISELYLAADVLLTDYSSAMFDFAVTGKPMIFFTYDLAEYRDEVRGFYFDLGDEAPGPLCEDTDEVVSALVDLDRVSAGQAGRYQRFRERFCHLEDGSASRRVVEQVFRRA